MDEKLEVLAEKIAIRAKRNMSKDGHKQKHGVDILTILAIVSVIIEVLEVLLKWYNDTFASKMKRMGFWKRWTVWNIVKRKSGGDYKTAEYLYDAIVEELSAVDNRTGFYLWDKFKS